MKITLTKAEMLARRRLAGGFGSARADCTIESTTGEAPDEFLEQQLRAWYLSLLDSGPVEYLAPEDVANEATVEPARAADGFPCVVVAPPQCRRPLSLRLVGWRSAVDVLPAEQYRHIAAAMFNPYMEATAEHPVAVRMPGPGCRIAAWPATGAVAQLSAAIDTGPDTYVLDEAAIVNSFNPNDFYPVC